MGPSRRARKRAPSWECSPCARSAGCARSNSFNAGVSAKRMDLGRHVLPRARARSASPLGFGLAAQWGALAL
eukprot:824047-Pyramimonas_sp.AAC.1